MDDASSRFVDTYNIIHNWMRKELDAPREDFWRLLDDMALKHPDFRRHVEHLRAFAEVRNLIVHKYSRERPLVVPSILSLQKFVAIKEQLLSPPRLLDFASTPVEQCKPTDPLGSCVKKMHDGVFSQLPVFEGNNYCGLLTAETIARWLATEFVGDWQGIVIETCVTEVLKHQENDDNYKFMSAKATVTEALSAFEEFQRNGKRLEAILITNSGSPTEPLLGIVTILDIPKLNQAVA